MIPTAKVVRTPQLDVNRVREALVAFYAEHNPERMTNIDPILDKYCGYEVELLRSLKDKYNVTNHHLIDNLLATYVPSSSSSSDTLSNDNYDQIPQPIDGNNGNETIGTSSAFAGLSSIGITNAAGRLLSGVSWGLNNESFAFAPSQSSDGDLSSNTKLFKMQAEIDRLELEKSGLESRVKNLVAQIAATNETNIETKEADLKEKMVDISNRLLTRLEALDLETQSLQIRNVFESRSQEHLVSEILYLRELLEILRSFAMDSISKNLVENNTSSSERVFFKDKLAFFCQKIGVDWANLDDARDRAFILQKELEKSHELLAIKHAELLQSTKMIEDLNEEIKLAKEYIDNSNSARQQISAFCSSRVRQAEIASDNRVQQQTQLLLMEREEVLSNIAHVSILQQHWQVEINNEQLREITRLREELTKSRRQEAQREKEVTFLQRQLQEAANRLARFENLDSPS